MNETRPRQYNAWPNQLTAIDSLSTEEGAMDSHKEMRNNNTEQTTKTWNKKREREIASERVFTPKRAGVEAEKQHQQTYEAASHIKYLSVRPEQQTREDCRIRRAALDR